MTTHKKHKHLFQYLFTTFIICCIITLCPLVFYNCHHFNDIDNKLADSIWHITSWNQSYNRSVYNSYVKSALIANENIDLEWRRAAFNDYIQYIDFNKNIIENIIVVCDKIKFQDNNTINHNDLSYRNLKSKNIGDCFSKSVYTAQILRSVGIPTSVDFVPNWGCTNNGHNFNSVILPSGNNICFSNIKELKEGGNLAWKTPKIYRYTTQEKIKDTKSYPQLFRENIIDVTSEFDIPQKDIRLDAYANCDDENIYLAVPNFDNWTIIAKGNRKYNKYEFNNIGYGFWNNKEANQYGENINEGILYLPVKYTSNNNITPLDFPFILSDNSIQKIIPDTNNKCQVTITRKYPRFKRIIDFAKVTQSYIIEGSDYPDFHNATTIVRISTKESHETRFTLTDKQNYKYFRIRNRRGGLMFAELGFYHKNVKQTGKVIFNSCLEGEDLSPIFDNDILTYIDFSGNISDLWIGMEFSKPQSIDEISFCPRTDDNDIKIGDTYELYYWENKWIPIGKEKALSDSIIFSNVPANGLYIIKDLNRGKEIRPFIIVNNIQKWL